MSRTESQCLFGAGRRILPPRGLLLGLILQIPPLWWAWPLRPARVAVLAGAAFLVAGVILNIRAERLFRRHNVGVCPFSPAPTLIGAGPYRITRNPMYLGMVLICASVPLLSGVYFSLWTAAALAVWLHVRFVLPEEDFLTEHLGLAYLLYESRNPRWLGVPGPRLTAASRRPSTPPA